MDVIRKCDVFAIESKWVDATIAHPMLPAFATLVGFGCSESRMSASEHDGVVPNKSKDEDTGIELQDFRGTTTQMLCSSTDSE